MSRIRELVYQNRSYRRFDGSYAVGPEVLEQLIDLGRMSPSGLNRQWLRYMPITEPEQCTALCERLGWAGYLKDWPGPDAGERPTAYIVMLEDGTHGHGHPLDAGIAAQSILLGATEMGLGGCILASFSQEQLARLLGVPMGMRIALVVAIGKPAEEIVVEPLAMDGDVKYWHEGRTHHVPKRPLGDVIVPVHFTKE